MTSEIIAIIAIGATLLGVVWRMLAGFRADIVPRFDKIDDDIRELRGDAKDLNERLGRVEGTLTGVDNRLVALEARMAHLENRLDKAISAS